MFIRSTCPFHFAWMATIMGALLLPSALATDKVSSPSFFDSVGSPPWLARQHQDRLDTFSNAPLTHSSNAHASSPGRSLETSFIMSSEQYHLPANTTIRYPAEYEAVASVLLTWRDWKDETLDIIEALLEQTQVDVFLAGDPTESYNDTDFIPLNFPVDTIWVRDFGPIGVLTSEAGSEQEEESMALLNFRYRLYHSRILDNHFPCEFAGLYDDWPCYGVPLIMDGGNLMSDGRGNVFTTTVTYDWNSHLSPNEVDELLKEYLGATTIHALDFAKDEDGEPLDGTGHIDMFAKLLGPCQVLVAETTSPIFDQVTDAAAEYFSNLACDDEGNTYEVFRTLAWATLVDDDYYEDGLLVWYTFTNSLYINDVILMPSFANATNDDAVAVYQSACPNCTVIPINMDGPITWAGAIHCMTRQLPAAQNSPSQMAINLPTEQETEAYFYYEFVFLADQCANLLPLFDGVTIFAPQDEAFLEYLQDRGDDWYEWWLGHPCNSTEGVAAVVDIISRHIVNETLLLADMLAMPGDQIELENLLGEVLTLDKSALTVNGIAIIDADAGTDGFVVHGINGALLPPVKTDTPTSIPSTPRPSEDAPTMSPSDSPDGDEPTMAPSGSRTRLCLNVMVGVFVGIFVSTI